MNICILENDAIDPEARSRFERYGHMFQNLFHQAGANGWTYEIFHTPLGEYPDTFERFDAVLLTGSKADSFSQEAWVLELRQRVVELIAQKKTLLGICFGHQLIALCLGAPVGRAPQGWGIGSMTHAWHKVPTPPSTTQDTTPPAVKLIVSHQDQVLALPAQAVLLASNPHCPVAAYALGQEIFCVQGHPEFEADYSAYLINQRRERLGQALYEQGLNSLKDGHDGVVVARMMVDFVHNKRSKQTAFVV